LIVMPFTFLRISVRQDLSSRVDLTDTERDLAQPCKRAIKSAGLICSHLTGRTDPARVFSTPKATRSTRPTERASLQPSKNMGNFAAFCARTDQEAILGNYLAKILALTVATIFPTVPSWDAMNESLILLW